MKKQLEEPERIKKVIPSYTAICFGCGRPTTVMKPDLTAFKNAQEAIDMLNRLDDEGGFIHGHFSKHTGFYCMACYERDARGIVAAIKLRNERRRTVQADEQ